ncbi:uncharacterized protein LOC141907531 [Tubulanus polymorphus]|uniref:uncharacterized protein LOC141907531 n=1 Tax=Tubulanus polymorphus TaxID=672921 RepID=UPI003DA6455D
MSEKTIVKLAASQLQREGGGFLVRRPIGSIIPSWDPFLMLDHIGPVDYKPGEAQGAPDHPHRGFQTVTYVIDGGVKHHDSAGNTGILKSGWVQWMTAGSGIVHAEMPIDDIYVNGGRSEGFQLWVNLPKKYKMIPPSYSDVSPDSIPTIDTGKVVVKVLAGEHDGHKSPVHTRIPILMLDIHLQQGSEFTLNIPEGHNAFAYVWRGKGYLGHEQKPAQMGNVALLSERGNKFLMTADNLQDCHVLVCTGLPIKEPVVRHGPFVMSTNEEIQQAIRDYQNGKLGSINGKEERINQTDRAAEVQKKNGTW